MSSLEPRPAAALQEVKRQMVSWPVAGTSSSRRGPLRAQSRRLQQVASLPRNSSGPNTHPPPTLTPTPRHPLAPQSAFTLLSIARTTLLPSGKRANKERDSWCRVPLYSPQTSTLGYISLHRRRRSHACLQDNGESRCLLLLIQVR